MSLFTRIQMAIEDEMRDRELGENAQRQDRCIRKESIKATEDLMDTVYKSISKNFNTTS